MISSSARETNKSDTKALARFFVYRRYFLSSMKRHHRFRQRFAKTGSGQQVTRGDLNKEGCFLRRNAATRLAISVTKSKRTLARCAASNFFTSVPSLSWQTIFRFLSGRKLPVLHATTTRRFPASCAGVDVLWLRLPVWRAVPLAAWWVGRRSL